MNTAPSGDPFAPLRGTLHAGSKRLSLISCRVTRMVLEAVEARGFDPADAVVGLPNTLEELREVRGRISWSDFADFFANVERTVGGPTEIESLGESVVRMPSYGFIGTAASYIVSARQLHELGARYFAPAFFPDLPVELVVVDDHTLVVRVALPPDWRSCPALFHFTKGGFAAISTLVGLPKSIVEGPINGRGCTLQISLPREERRLRTLLRRARARVAGVPIDSLLEQQAAVNESYQALLQSRQEFRDLLERAPLAAVIHRDGRYLWVNAAAAQMLGWERPADIVGRPILDDVHPEDRPRVMERLAKPATASTTSEYRVLRRDGSFAVGEFAATHDVVFQGAPARLLIGSDVSERARVREQLALSERMKSLGMLAAGVAHEINNPLTYVLLNMEGIARELSKLDVPPSMRTAAETAIEGLDRVRAIVADLRTFARASDDSLGPVDLGDVVTSTLRLAEKTLATGARIELALEECPPVTASRGQLGQVVLNLLINAHEAIEERGAAGVIRVRSARLPSGDVVLEIADNGVGISAEVLSRAFEPFFTTKAAGRGTGLGLAICHRIVSGFGGDITIESTRATDDAPNLRTFVRVRLRPSERARVATPAPERPSTKRARRILVVDDEPEVGNAIRATLADDHEVVVVDGGRAALEVLRGASFDVILCDVMMPEMDGIELLEELRRSQPSLASRVVFMSGGAFTARARAFLSTCDRPRIEKPFGIELLTALLESAAL